MGNADFVRVRRMAPEEMSWNCSSVVGLTDRNNRNPFLLQQLTGIIGQVQQDPTL